MSSTDKVTSRQARVHGLWRPDLLAAATIGVVFWLLAVLIVHYGVPAGLFDGWSRIILYVVTAALTWAGIVMAGRSAGWDDLLPAVCVATAAATFCDVAAMTWTPGLYGSNPARVLSGAIWILWGVGWTLAPAILRKG